MHSDHCEPSYQYLLIWEIKLLSCPPSNHDRAGLSGFNLKDFYIFGKLFRNEKRPLLLLSKLPSITKTMAGLRSLVSSI